VTLGETHEAERAAGEALAAGAEQADALRHPERAAAWLRARVLLGLRQSSRATSMLDAVRREALAALGAGEAVFRGLAPLRVDARAALVASAIERFEPIDIETILGAGAAVARRRIAEARHQYAQAVGAPPDGEPGTSPEQPDGELAVRVLGIAARTMAVDEAQA
jgi:DNA-directed RNA polymerase specialized sigma24 family protein